MNIAMIVAGGVGSRMNHPTPKQFIMVKSKPVIIYTLEIFQNNDQIDEVIVVCLEGWEEVLWKYIKKYNLDKVKWIVKGGSTGMQSIRNGVDLLAEKYNENDIILIHDAVRPLLTDDIINENIACVMKNGNAVTYIPSTEVLLISEDGKTSTSIMDRDKVLRTQTPQSLRLGKLVSLHKRAKEKNIDNLIATCSLLIEFGETIYTVRGINSNFKITSGEDIALFCAYLNNKENS